MQYEKVISTMPEEEAPFWKAAAKGQLVAQRCRRCGSLRKEVLPSSPVCPKCLSMDYGWSPLKGSGEIHSFIIFHRVFHADFAARAPYNVAIVRLDEGPLLLSNVVGCSNKDISIGMRVQAMFEQVTEDVAVPHFKPV